MYRRNKFKIQKFCNPRITYITSSPRMRNIFEALMLLEYKEIKSLYNLSDEDIQEYKNKVLDIDSLISAGRPYIIDFLEREKNAETLSYYTKGVDYTLARAGYTVQAAPAVISDLFHNMVFSTVLDGMDLNGSAVDIRGKCIKYIRQDIKEKESVNVIDKLADIVKNIDL